MVRRWKLWTFRALDPEKGRENQELHSEGRSTDLKCPCKTGVLSRRSLLETMPGHWDLLLNEEAEISRHYSPPGETASYSIILR